MDRRSSGVRLTEAGGHSLVSLDLGEWDGLPAVHGWVGLERARGEFSLVEERGGAVVRRDPLGTRPLYVAESGGWMASDHRFVRDEPFRQLPPGCSLEVGRGAQKVEKLAAGAFTGDFLSAATELAGRIEAAVRERVAGRRCVAVAFSGGLDSAILAVCAARHAKVVASTASAAASRDRTAARDAAGQLGIEHLSSRLDERSVAAELKAVDLPFEPSRMDQALWCVYSLAARKAAEAGAEFIMLGQLADELFGGYAKYERAASGTGPAAAAAMMESDVWECGRRGFLRDEAACSRALQPRFPFADALVSGFALSLPVRFKIREGTRKAVLREAARILRVPEEMVAGPKKAAQYSTGVMKLLP